MRHVPYLNLKQQHSSLKQKLLEAVDRVLDDGDFILGKEVSTFEKNIAQYCSTRFAVGVNSGTDAIFLVLKAYGIGNGDEVITASNSFLATASAVIATGAVPVFVDIRSDLNIDPALIEKKITKKTKAILPVHLTGNPADMDPILSLAKKYNLYVLEDAAQAIGSQYLGRRVGSFGNAGCFSLHPLKTLNACGDGGVITTSDDRLYSTLIQLRNIGLKNRDESDMWGFNSRLDSIQAAILNVKLSRLDEWTESRRKNALLYTERLRRFVEVPTETKGGRSVYHTYVIQTDRRDDLRDHLLKNGIETKIHYPIPIHLQKTASSLGYRLGDLPKSEKAATRILSLPVYQGLITEDIDYIIEMIEKFFRHS